MTRKRKLASVSNALAVVDYLYTPDRLDAGYVITRVCHFPDSSQTEPS